MPKLTFCRFSISMIDSTNQIDLSEDNANEVAKEHDTTERASFKRDNDRYRINNYLI